MKRSLILTAFIAATLSLHSKAEETSLGQKVFERRCSGCHSLDRDKEGPRLRGVYGRRSGATPTFLYSEGLRKAQISWDEASLDRWLADPEKLVPDTDMGFRLTNPDERKQIIAYLKQLSNCRSTAGC